MLEVIHAAARIAGLEVPYDIVGRRSGDPLAGSDARPEDPRLVGEYGLDEIIQTAYDLHCSQVATDA